MGDAFSAVFGLVMWLLMGQYLFRAMPLKQVVVKKLVICSQCAARNPIEYTFCSKCGQRLYPLLTTCSKCHSKNPAPMNYCGQCGAVLKTSK